MGVGNSRGHAAAAPFAVVAAAGRSLGAPVAAAPESAAFDPRIGWGEHGNCGKSRDVDGGDVVGAAFNVRVPAAAAAAAAVGGRLASAGAGCATSWVWAE